MEKIVRTPSRFPALSFHRSPKARSKQSPLEALESRSLLSVTLVSPHIATFTDIDGDLVTVTVNKGVLTADLFTSATAGQGEQLQLLNLGYSIFGGTNVRISV